MANIVKINGKYVKDTTARNEITNLISQTGELTNLNTTAKNNLVAAINEVAQSGGSGSVDLYYVTPEQYGAVGDGVTDDSQAVQDACDAGYAVYFDSGKTYYLASTVTIDHDCHLFGGEGATIKTKTPTGGVVNKGIVVQGTLKATTTLTTDYTSDGNTNNAANRLTLTNMSDVEIGDIIVVKATDQYYSYARQYFYLGAALEVVDMYDGHIYVGRNMPFDITLTANVSVAVYAAPKASIENLHFVSDLDSFGTYNALLHFNQCKSPELTNCTFDHFVMGVYFTNCVNALVDCVSASKSKYDNSISGDGYAITIQSCTNTTVRHVIALCSQSCLDLTGDVPNIDTYVYQCELGSECRSGGIGMHENTYGIVIEDCVLGGVNGTGPMTINRCQFFKNLRPGSDGYAVSYSGGHNSDWTTLKITNCDFGGMSVNLGRPGYQSGIQPIDNVIGSVIISDCKSGALNINPSVDSNVLSNTINNLIINHWEDCYEIFHPAGQALIRSMIVSNSTFKHSYFINGHSDTLVLDDIEYLDYSSINPMSHRIYVQKTSYGENILLPEYTPIHVSSNNPDAKFIVTGSNLVSNNAADYVIGTVSGNDGSPISRVPATSPSAPTFSIDGSGNIVFIQKNNTSSYSIYPVGMVYVKENSDITMTATLVNSGETSGATFKPFIAAVDCATGNLIYRNPGNAVQATSGGATITYSYSVPKNSVVMCYYYCNSAVANAVTTFTNYTIQLVSKFTPAYIDQNESYQANRRTGDGILYSLGGINNIITSESQFSLDLFTDYVNSPMHAFLPSALGVNF